MSNANLITQKDHTIGDAAVDGLLNGIIAGVGMGLYILLIFLVNSVPAGEIIKYFGNVTESPLVSALIHLAISGIYGVLFGLAFSVFSNRWRKLLSIWVVLLAGIVYGALLWLVATYVVFNGSPSVEIIPGVHLLIAHIVFGVFLGFLTGRSGSE